MPANIRGRLALDLAEYLESIGHDPVTAFAQAGFPSEPVVDQNARVSVEALMDLIDIAAKQVDQADFGLRLARFRGMPDLGPLALLLREQDRLGDALSTIAQAFYLHSNAMYLSIVESDEHVTLVADLIANGKGLSRQSSEMIVGSIAEMIRTLIGPSWTPQDITFRHTRVLPAAVYRKHFGVSANFNQESNAIVLARSDLARPLRNKDIDVDGAAQAIIDSAASTASVFVYRVKQLIVLTLPQGEARADRIAELLTINRRTMHRRLRASGVTFTELLHDVRIEFAVQYVRGSSRSLSEIALFVGFESLAVFTRWFRKSTGQTPSACRSEAQAITT